MAKERLWATWRMPYITKIDKNDEGCIFCNKPKEDDDKKNLILYRGEHCFTIMNLYPYNNGHLMVIPYRHISDICLLDDNEAMDMMDQVRSMVAILRKVMNPEGFNTGLNLGRAGGAGIADHMHMHIVPRWSGDTNFMPVVADTRVISEHINDTYDKIYNAIKNEVK